LDVKWINWKDLIHVPPGFSPSYSCKADDFEEIKDFLQGAVNALKKMGCFFLILNDGILILPRISHSMSSTDAVDSSRITEF